MRRDVRFLIVVILLVVSVLILPQLALPYGRLDWQNFSSIYHNFVQYLPLILKNTIP
jgi:hypothetical protein